LGEAFNALLDRLSESFLRQKQFTGDASHQLRTPLTAMQGQIDLALKQERSEEEYRRVLVLLQRKTRHLRRIVESLLFLARADAEVAQPKLEAVDLTAWLPEHTASWNSLHAARNVSVVTCDAGPVWVRAHPVLLGELLNNLLENAAKYSDASTPIEVSLKREGTLARIAVEDHGLGMSPDETKHVFEPFYRGATASGRISAGLGLGLAVASRVAHVFGGTIEVESALGRGSRFTVELPIATDVGPLEVGERRVQAGHVGQTF
jgi:signal transduction histidine kinase